MKRRYKPYARSPKTASERRANQDSEYVRGKRLPSMLPDDWEDIWIKEYRSWKKKRKTQYVGRGKRHVIKLGKGFYSWEVEDYFRIHGIPYRLETIKRPEYRPGYTMKEVPDKERQKLFPWTWPLMTKYVRVPNGETWRYSVFDHYRLTWWSDKDIGIDYILRSTQRPDFEGYECL